MKEIDYYNQNPEKRRELMDYETRLKDERLIGIKEGRREGRQEGEKIGEEKGIKKGVRNVIIESKANQAAPSFIFQFVKNAYRGKLTDEEIQQMIDEVEERN